MITPKEKLYLMRQAEKDPKTAVLNMISLFETRIQAVIGLKLAEIEAKLPETAVLKHIEKLKGDKGDTGDSVNKEEVVQAIKPVAVKEAVAAAVQQVKQSIRQPKDGKDGAEPSESKIESMIKRLLPTVKDGHTPTESELKKIVEPMIPSITEIMEMVKDMHPTKSEIDALIKDAITKEDEEEKLTGEQMVQLIDSADPKYTIDASRIRNLPRQKKDKSGKTDRYLHGGGDIVKVYDISASLNGVTKTFTIPRCQRVLAVHFSSAPFSSSRNGVDYTTTATSVTFTSEITAASTLASGQSCLIEYVEG